MSAHRLEARLDALPQHEFLTLAAEAIAQCPDVLRKTASKKDEKDKKKKKKRSEAEGSNQASDHADPVEDLEEPPLVARGEA